MRDPRSRRIAYWTATVLISLAFLSGGAVYLAGVEEPVRGLTQLGYPAYFITILGAWKVLGGLAVLAPGSPRLKEWAYAGITFDLSGASLSHAASGDPVIKIVVPLLLLGLAFASWALRPAGRALAAPAGRARERAGAPVAVEASA